MLPRNCNFCGLCCTLAVKATPNEIKKIENLGYSSSDFTEKDAGGNTILKRPNGWCYFLERKDGVGYCKIYGKRPAPCRDFPGKKLCDLRGNVVFRLGKMKPKVRLLWEKAPKKGDPLPKEEPEFPL